MKVKKDSSDIEHKETLGVRVMNDTGQSHSAHTVNLKETFLCVNYDNSSLIINSRIVLNLS